MSIGRKMNEQIGEMGIKMQPYVKPVAEFFKNAEQEEVQQFRSRQALDGVKKNCLGMMGLISESLDDFNSAELKAYNDSRDKDGTNTARGLIDDINHILFEDVLRANVSRSPKGFEPRNPIAGTAGSKAKANVNTVL